MGNYEEVSQENHHQNATNNFSSGFFCQQVISNIFIMTSLKAAAFINKS